MGEGIYTYVAYGHPEWAVDGDTQLKYVFDFAIIRQRRRVSKPSISARALCGLLYHDKAESACNVSQPANTNRS